ncbi:MAG: DNA sulfur modification protein DndD [Spirochaetales bacterium]|jgi:DNA sulfur modification protein DndD|nr:DNA sulfur modification protein DndD [Spirochaetales bacterium]|tara:strand:+ start:1870 stop:3837 length:1968 start_codon:yes stop_codon:yes gene_type:complete
MISFHRLELENFGIYRGCHTIDLRPVSPKKSIVLFGGLNGGGKTTFLDALQLVLYGKFARCSNRKDLGYEEYLAESINKYVEDNSSARLELEFVFDNGETEDRYNVQRSWKHQKKGIKETVVIFRNGEFDDLLSREWYSAVDEFIPRDVSELFFFDGEKIEELANAESSSRIIRTGIYSLLGLGLIDKLGTDLRTINLRKDTEELDRKSSSKLKSLEDELSLLRKNRSQLQSSLASKNTKLDSQRNAEREYRDRYKNLGGELYDQRESHENTLRQLKDQLQQAKTDIGKFAEGESPLLLVQDLLQCAKKQSANEAKAISSRELLNGLEARDEEILAKFENHPKSEGLRKALRTILEEDRISRGQEAKKETPLNVDSLTLLPFTPSYFADLQSSAKKLYETYSTMDEKLTSVTRLISTIPDEELLSEVATQLLASTNEIELILAEMKGMERLIAENQKSIDSKKMEISRLFKDQIDTKSRSDINKKIIRRSERVQDLLNKYKIRLIGKHIERLENLIRDSFQLLLRKDDLIKGIRICPDSFALVVIGNDDSTLPPDRLSAGERQLLAISILWGLGKASEKTLPVIIDTPLGRLDSNHRSQLLNNYFPVASHQMILLSTDEEIDRQYRDELEPSIGKEYHIQYDDSKKTSTINPGYF